MSVSLHTLALTSQHPLGVFQVGGLAASTVTVVAGSEVFYGEQDLNADEHFGSLKEGESKTFIQPTWLLSNHSSKVEVRDYSPEHAVEQLKVGKDGTVQHPSATEPVVGVTVDKPKRKERKPTEEEKQREHTAAPHREDAKPSKRDKRRHEAPARTSQPGTEPPEKPEKRQKR